MADKFFLLRANGLSRDQEDEFTDRCFELGASGVAEDLKFVQKDLRYDPEVVDSASLDLNVYFTSTPGESTVLQLQSAFPQVRFEMTAEENRDWLTEWKKGFKPFLFSAPFWVVPSWCEPPAEAKEVLLVEPGMAFGTGTHETTRLAGGLIIEELKRHRAKSLLDVGTGTGILALIAQRLGVQRIVGVDIDPEARRTARENFELNRSTGIEIPDANVEDLTETYEIVVANIIDGVLLVLADALNSRLEPGGRMILSGVLMDRECEFYQQFTSATGLKILKKVSEGEWSGAILEKAR